MSRSRWIPEIMYEETDEGLSSNIPFIMVPANESMPQVVFIFEGSCQGASIGLALTPVKLL